MDPYFMKIRREILFLRSRRDAWWRGFGLPVFRDDPAHGKRRREAVKFLCAKGIVSRNGGKTLFTGRLSPGCILCLRGENNNFVPTFACNKHCFFCYQPRGKAVAAPRRCPPLDMRLLLRQKELKSFSVSGGEPLLAPGATLRRIQAVKKRFGAACRIHLYTNGALATDSILRDLGRAGLDEIRLNLAACDYNSAVPASARRFIPSVMVEIPVIPGHEARITGLMAELDAMGADGLNLHELLFFGHNRAEYKRRGFALRIPARQPFYAEAAVPVAGSEEAAFRLLEAAVRLRCTLPVHYCSCGAKQEVQHVRKRYLRALAVRRPFEKVLPSGLLERLVVSGAGSGALLRTLENAGVRRENISVFRREARLFTHPDTMRYLGAGEYEAAVVRALPDGRDVGIRLVKGAG